MPGGIPDYSLPVQNPAPSPWNLECGQLGTGMPAPMPPLAPPPLCLHAGTSLTIAVPVNDPGVNNVAIFTIPPVTGDAFGCIGFQLDTQNNLPEGPACVSVVAKDMVGNMNVTLPLRLCTIAAAANARRRCGTPGTYPNCTGTYTKSTNSTDASVHCNSNARFRNPDVRNID